MVPRDKILKVDVLTPSGIKIISVGAKQFSIPSAQNETTGTLENVLMIKGHSLPEIDSGCMVSIITYSKNGQRIKYGGIVKLSTELQLNIVLLLGDAQLMEERRRFYKVDANISCCIKRIVRPDEDILLEQPSVANILDFNIGGVFLCVSDITFSAGDIITITLFITEHSVEVEAEVLRAQRNPAGDIYGYGCRFINVTPKIEETFAKFVYQAQLEALKKQK